MVTFYKTVAPSSVTPHTKKAPMVKTKQVVGKPVQTIQHAN